MFIEISDCEGLGGKGGGGAPLLAPLRTFIMQGLLGIKAIDITEYFTCVVVYLRNVNMPIKVILYSKYMYVSICIPLQTSYKKVYFMLFIHSNDSLYKKVWNYVLLYFM